MATIRRHTTSKRLVAAAAIPAAVLASGALVFGASYSAFSATTVNPTNNWTSGTVVLADDDNNTALFNATNLKPGASGEKCIKVSSTGSLASTVKLYGTGYATTNGLASQIDLKVEEGNGGANADCTGFTAVSGAAAYTGTLAAFGTGSSAKTDFATGVGTWAPAGASSSSPATRTYKITYTLKADAPNSAQGGSASIGLTWEAQNS